MTDEPRKIDFEAMLHGNTPKQDDNPDIIELGKCVTVYPKGAKALDIEVGTKPIESVQYCHICHHARFSTTSDGQMFWFIFGTMEKHRVTVYGRRLRDVFNRISDHCARVIRAQDRRYDLDESVPFIWKIEVKLLPSDFKEED